MEKRFLREGFKKVSSLLLCLITTSLYSQDLDHYLYIARSNNPKLKTAQNFYESSREAVNEAGSLPNTTFSAGYFIQETETPIGPMRARISAQQQFPWFGTLHAKKQSARSAAQATSLQVQIAEKVLTRDVKQHYYALFLDNTALTTQKKHLKILESYEELALKELENKRSSMIDILKIRICLNNLKNTIETSEENLQTGIKAFNLLLNRDITLPVIIPDSLAVVTPDFKKENIIHNPALLELDARKEALVQSEIVSKKEGLPSIGVGLDYIWVDEQPAGNIPDNGRDIIMPMVSVSLPLFSKKYSSRQKQLQWEQQAVENKKTNVKNELEVLFDKSISAMTNAYRKIMTLKENTKQAEKAENVFLTTYQTSKIDFQELLEILELKLNFQMETIEATKTFFDNRILLEYITAI
ncbi:TolC family protein [Ascidiimonas aurantiaca]|uniref:TolC family protein n=1 Tax=Ascidiimonas aurantiaca TaxID=1685432 RepID=UPI0030EB5B66